MRGERKGGLRVTEARVGKIAWLGSGSLTFSWGFSRLYVAVGAFCFDESRVSETEAGRRGKGERERRVRERAWGETGNWGIARGRGVA